MLRCRLLGHRLRFAADGATLRWRCVRECGAEGARRYPTAAHARRYAEAFERESAAGLGRRAPPFGLLPLRLVRRVLDRAR
jgi:hypothetical protein